MAGKERRAFGTALRRRRRPYGGICGVRARAESIREIGVA